MLGYRQAGADAGERAGEVSAVVAHQAVGIGRIAFLVAVAGDDQVIGERAHQAMQVGDQGQALPLDQALVATAHALAAASRQEKDGAGGRALSGIWGLRVGPVI